MRFVLFCLLDHNLDVVRTLKLSDSFRPDGDENESATGFVIMVLDPWMRIILRATINSLA